MSDLALDRLVAAIGTNGFAFVASEAMRPMLEMFGTLDDWSDFAASWDDLGLDTYMADGGRYRKRRHGVFRMAANTDLVVRQPHQPHYQSRDYNALNGGIERWFEPILPQTEQRACFSTLLRACNRLFSRLTPDAGAWHVEAHQFRISARFGESGQPTPEGQHRDGVDHVLVMLVGRRNIASGVTTIQGPGGIEQGRFTLTAPLDSAFVEDARVTHGVTAVAPIDPNAPAQRDVLVVTFKRMFDETRTQSAAG